MWRFRGAYAFQGQLNRLRSAQEKALHFRRALLSKSILIFQTLNDEPQPQVLFTLGFSNLKPAPSSVST